MVDSGDTGFNKRNEIDTLDIIVIFVRMLQDCLKVWNVLILLSEVVFFIF